MREELRPQLEAAQRRGIAAERAGMVDEAEQHQARMDDLIEIATITALTSSPGRSIH